MAEKFQKSLKSPKEVQKNPSEKITSFLDLSKDYRKKETAAFAVIPLSYEKETTYGKGASKGPQAILNASAHMEYYEEQFDNEPFLEGIYTYPIQELSENTPEEATQTIKELAKQSTHPFPLFLGGDHAVTIGIVRGLEEQAKHKKDPFDVIVFDAHSDFRYSWNGSQLNHACVSRRIHANRKMVLAGIRSQDSDEARELKEHKNMKIIKSYDYSFQEFCNSIKNLKKKVYISFDVDVFDPAFLRHTGTPEPGGFDWNTCIQALMQIFSEKEVIGMDIVEFAPEGNEHVESYALARLCYKVFSLYQKYQN